MELVRIMRISESCAACLYDKQKNKTDDEEYLAEIRSLLDNRKETDTRDDISSMSSCASVICLRADSRFPDLLGYLRKRSDVNIWNI